MSLSTCNILTNPSFESGSLSPWYTNDPSFVRVTNGTPAYDGTYSLNLTTQPNNDNPQTTISQTLTNLTRNTAYDFSIEVKVPVSRGIEDCTVTAYTGSNATSGVIASAEIDPSGSWTACDGEDNENDRGVVYLDEVVLGRRGC
ncbi:hypothetical protein BO94DRAFT_625974 [Aspergillus sclerotioniger CBS 115572]|uniref:CBM-cenC domain-containing protein n=1 Tax=Aspergillus sclerotioniger CBS 115572 TaxID=1450535 RepID=A0A317W9Y2_9EURO|nr:hypothetical protein BO94DRAFT_625974 [Aspergillus sclerotioniger CBS 115572]PWY80870.1 hypothetical protein BO94DRAFT_625974 [Aspergillus sclerotioniger CBS 115572]